MAKRNVTVDPRARAKAAKNLRVEEVVGMRSGRIWQARELIESQNYQQTVEAGLRIKEAIIAGRPHYVCGLCGAAVRLINHQDKAFHFRHIQEDGSCPRMRRVVPRDERMLFRNVKESEAHIRLKKLIERSLRADPRFRDSVAVETPWCSQHEPREFRRPDVRATSDNLKLAFEAQVTPQLLAVLVDRKAFYREEGALMVWILARFCPSNRRITEDRILFSNNSNVLVVDRITTMLSEKNGRFMVRCHYRKPFSVGQKIADEWCERIISWDGLKYDLEKQELYFFDFRSAEIALKVSFDSEISGKIIDHVLLGSEDEEGWRNLWQQAEQRGIDIGTRYGPHPWVRAAILSFLSAQKGEPVGYRFNKIIEVAHYLYQNFPAILLSFGKVLQGHGNQALLEHQDRKGRWKRKAHKIRERIKNRDPEFCLKYEQKQTLQFLFPDFSIR